MKASLKGKYDYESGKGLAPSAVSTFAFPAGDFRFRACFTDSTIVKGPSLSGLSLALDNPGVFTLEYDFPQKDFRFQFVSSVRVFEKPLDLAYIHSRNDNRTILEGNLAFDPANKVSFSHTLGSENGSFKYTYLRDGDLAIEPRYDLGKNAWDFAVSRKLYGDDVVRASYQTSNKVLGIEWARNSKTHGCFKVSGSVNLGEEVKRPKLVAESTWNIEI